MRTPYSIRNALITGALTAALVATACSGPESTDDEQASISLRNCGQQVTLSAPAKAAITVNQGATESALAVDAGSKLKATAYLDDTIAPQWAAAYAKIPVLSKEYPSREKLLEQRPDLVAASYSSAFDDKALGSRDSLRDLGIATYVSPFACANEADRAPSTWQSIEGELRDYGTLFGESDKAGDLIDAQRAALTQITTRAAGKGKTILWYDSATNTPYVGGGSGGPQLIIDAVGGTNIFKDLKGNWGDGNWETVLKANPDVIVLADASWDTAAAKRKYLEQDPALKDLRAVRDGAFVVIPFSESTPGPRTVDGAKALDKYLAGA